MTQTLGTPTSSAINATPPTSLVTFAGMLLLALMWGLSIPVTKLGLISMPPLTLTALRFAIAVPLMLALVVGRQRLPFKAVPQVAALGILGITVGQVAQTYGVTGTTASVGTIISATIPVFIVLLAALRLKQAVTGVQMLGVAAAFAGIVVVALENEGAGFTDMSISGPAFMLLSAVAVAVYYVWSVELANRYGTATVAGWSTVFGFLGLLPFAGWEAAHTPFEVTFLALASAAYLGLFVTVAGLFLWLHLLRKVPAGVAASVQYLQPVFGIGASAAIFGDAIGIHFAAGVAMILAGMAMAITRRRPRR